jgi:ABC-type branched-subunit amino acid transport system substrate-binding protein
MIRPHHTKTVLALAAVAALTGCGSTVQSDGATALAGNDGLGSPVIPGDGAAVPSGGSAVGPGSGRPRAGGGLGPRSSLTASAARTGTGAKRKLPPIEIGTYYLSGGNEALAAMGFGGLVIPDNKPLFDAMVKYLNARGGLGGRQIRPVYYEYRSGGDPHAQDAAACSTFTEDHNVYLVIGGINSGAGELGPCLTKRGVPLIGANGGGDARYFRKNHRFIYEPGQASFTRGLTTLVANLHATGWFRGKHQIGLVQYEGPIYDHAVDDGLVPALARLGLRLADRVKVSPADNNSIAQGSANAALKFKTNRIDRVVFMEPGGAVATYFMNAASTQQYRPLYGIWSADSPYVLGITAPKDQLAGATGIGYQPGLDVASEQDPTATTPVAKACLAFWDSVGQTDHSALNNPLQRATCDIFHTLLRAVAASPHTTTSTAALEDGYNAIGGRYSPAATFAMRFRVDGHDAASGYRRLNYQTDCSCFTYVGPTRPLP